MKQRLSFKLIFAAAMSLIYLVFGLALLLTDKAIIPIIGGARVAIAVLTLLYGVYRFSQAYSLYSKKERNFRNDSTLLVLMALMTLPGCGYRNPGAGNQSTDTAFVSVDETLRPILQAEADVYQVMDTLGELKLDYIPEGQAIQRLLDLKSIMAVASRQLTQKEVDFLKEKSYVPRQTKIATDAVALVAHSSTKDTIFSVDQVKAILTGKISNWNQLDKKNPSMPIKVVFDNENSSIVRYMVDSICQGAKLAKNSYALEFNRDVIDYVAKTPGVIGFIGTAWITDREDSLHLSFHKKIKVISVSNDTEADAYNSYKPYQAYIADGVYPFSRDIYMINAEPVSGKATRFASFVAGSRGQRIILKAGIIPAIAPTRVISVKNSL